MTREQRTRSRMTICRECGARTTVHCDRWDCPLLRGGMPMNAAQRLFFEWLNMAIGSDIAAIYASTGS